MKKILLLILLFLSSVSAFAQYFTPGNLVVSRYGTGVDNLPKNNTTVPVFLDEYDLSGNLVHSLALPVERVEENRNRVLTGSADPDQEGLLTLSPNGHYLVAIGHDVLPGKKFSRETHRTVGVITSDGHVNVRTGVRPNIGVPHCAITNNGVNLWIVGGSGGLKYKAINTGITNDVVISRPPRANNSVYIYNNQLYYTSNYGASADGPKVGVVGEGLPLEPSQVTNLPGFPTDSRPGQMVMLDHDTRTPEPDLLYITLRGADILQKWVYNGARWEDQGAVHISGVTNAISGLTGKITEGNVVLYANTPGTILRFKDEQAITSDFSAAVDPDTLAIAPDNTIFRGIAFTPGTTVKPEKQVSSSSEYGDMIMSKTGLIREITKNETYHPYPGVEETHLSYVSNRGVPIAVHFLKVNLKNANTDMEVITPYDKSDWARQTIRKMIGYKNASENAYQVVAASNGDYFHWTGEPRGGIHKDGEIIKELPDGLFFLGMLDDGTAVIGDHRIYTNVKEDLKEAVSGRFFLMHYGEVMTDHLKDTSIEPRTTAGLLSPEHVVFMWVDGRRAGHSAGLSLRDMARIYKAIGAVEAINLDGGGSSTFLMRDKDGSYRAANWPSDRTGERAVANGIAVLMKKEILKTKPSEPGKPERAVADELLIYPSPVTDRVTLDIAQERESPALQLTLTHSSGFGSLSVEGTLEEINSLLNNHLPNLETGVYLVKVKGNYGTYTSRLVKK